jgi:hypothetical protein
MKAILIGSLLVALFFGVLSIVSAPAPAAAEPTPTCTPKA